jgi:hypothetical protein
VGACKWDTVLRDGVLANSEVCKPELGVACNYCLVAVVKVPFGEAYM